MFIKYVELYIGIAIILSPMTINHQTIAEFSNFKLMMQCLFDAVNRAENPSVLV